MGKIWKFVKWYGRGCMSKEDARLEKLKEDMKEEWERTHTCKICGKIFAGEVYPF